MLVLNKKILSYIAISILLGFSIFIIGKENKLKCPICNTNLEVLVGGANAVLGCPRCRYKATDGVWQELIRTRKALDVAVDALKWIHETYNLGMGYEAAIMEKCEFALEQITALEQKD